MSVGLCLVMDARENFDCLGFEIVTRKKLLRDIASFVGEVHAHTRCKKDGPVGVLFESVQWSPLISNRIDRRERVT